jgi:hypothetical protein
MFSAYFTDDLGRQLFKIEKKGTFIYYVIITLKGRISIVQGLDNETQPNKPLIDYYKQNKRAFAIKKIFTTPDQNVLYQINVINVFKRKIKQSKDRK